MHFDRRDLLTSFLGVAAATAACREKAPPREVPTTLVDVVHETGHLLRGPPLPRTSDVEAVDCVIVGGGVAGLSAAWRLAGAGVDFRLLEADSVLGGTSKSGQNSTSRFPWGAHYLPAPLSVVGPAPRLLDELGVLTSVAHDGTPTWDEAALVHEPEERLYFRGGWYEGLYLRAGATPDDVAQLSRFEAQMEAFAGAVDGKGRKAFAVPIELGSDDAEWTALDRLSMAEWLRTQGYTSSRLWWLVDYACRDDYGASAELVSAWAGLWYFCARQRGSERNEGFLTWPEGNGRLVAQLAKSVQASQRQGDTLVHAVEPAPESTDWLVHALHVPTKRPRCLRARQVVMATPRFVTAHVLAPWKAQRPDFLDAFQVGPWTVANLSVRAPPRSRGFPLSWDNVLYESKSLGYVVSTHQALSARTGGPAVLTWYYPHASGDVVAERKRLFSTTADDWRALVLGDLRPAHVKFDDVVESIEVMRWGHAMVRPVPGFVWGSARRAAQTSLGPSLHFAHSDLGGLALFEEANWHGVKAAEAALAVLRPATPSWLDARAG